LERRAKIGGYCQEQVENTKKTRRKTTPEQNTNGKHAECDHVKKGSESERKAAKHMKINI
jgi:hypothetical protein